jgi:hypothetical protein
VTKQGRRWTGWRRSTIGTAIVIALCALLFRHLDVGQLRAAFARADLGIVTAAALFDEIAPDERVSPRLEPRRKAAGRPRRAVLPCRALHRP